MDSQGGRLLSKTLDVLAETEPARRLLVIPRGSELAEGFRDVSMKDMAQAVNFMCWWLESALGPAQHGETLAYMGRNDVRYLVFLLACQKMGYQPFFPSTRNSDDAHLHLLNATSCSKFLYSKEREERAMEIQNLYPTAAFFEVPDIASILNDENGAQIYPCSKSFEDTENDTTCIIHSSGTTGLPKPVYLTNGFFAAFDSLAQLQAPPSRQIGLFTGLGPENLLLGTTPLFHLVGLVVFVAALLHGPPMLLAPEKPLSVDFLVDLMKMGRPTLALYPPSVLDDLSNSDEGLVCLRDLKAVYYGGAPLAQETGDKLSKYTRVVNVLGSSEMGWVPSLVPEGDGNWGYFEWHPAYGIEMQDIGDGHLFEMVIPRKGKIQYRKAIFHTFPDLEEYRSNDLYTRHPTNPDLWKYHGRADDVVILSNGEKFNPVTMETIIEGHPLVARAVVFRQSRFQAGLLVEPNPELEMVEPKQFIDEIWPTVQAANQVTVAHARVMKNKIGLASKAKPFKTTPKGTTQRRTVLRDYEEEIDAIYSADQEELDQYLPEVLDKDGITQYIRQTVARVLQKPDVPDQQDFYSAGLDSLMTIQVSRILTKGVRLRQPERDSGSFTLSAQAIYANPTVEKLSQVLSSSLSGDEQMHLSREERLASLIEKYTADLPVRHDDSQSTASPSTVILTGSTGSLGTYLLNELLSCPSVSKVYCLNRSDNAEIRQRKLFEERGLHLNAAGNRLEFLQASFGEPLFGLNENRYEELLETVDTIIHNAWKVDFNHSVDSFEDTHIRGVRRFVDFSSRSKRNAHLHFISSIGTVGGWDVAKMGPSIPEVPLEDISVVLPQGYGESKHVAERICVKAAQCSRLHTTIYRVGQIAGPTTSNGQWNPNEWLPTIIATSKTMGKIPKRLGSMEVGWVPVDTLSSILVEIVHTRHTKSDPAVFNLVNPQRTAWSSLIPAIQEQYAVEPVEFEEWVKELESINNPSPADVAEKPALKLLDFYRGLLDSDAHTAGFGVKRAKEASGVMRSLQAISPSLMRNWLQQWKF